MVSPGEKQPGNNQDWIIPWKVSSERMNVCTCSPLSKTIAQSSSIPGCFASYPPMGNCHSLDSTALAEQGAEYGFFRMPHVELQGETGWPWAIWVSQSGLPCTLLLVCLQEDGGSLQSMLRYVPKGYAASALKTLPFSGTQQLNVCSGI